MRGSIVNSGVFAEAAELPKFPPCIATGKSVPYFPVRNWRKRRPAKSLLEVTKRARTLILGEEGAVRDHLFATAVCLALPVCASAQDRAAMQKLDNQYAAAFNTGDTAAIASLYKDDAVLLTPGAEVVQGKADIEAFAKRSIESLGDMTLTAVDVKPLGNSVVREIGTFTLKTKGQTPPREIVGKYVNIWERVGEDWKMTTRVWSVKK
jgi:uncharacterized protein (TIGR02246 family)